MLSNIRSMVETSCLAPPFFPQSLVKRLQTIPKVQVPRPEENGWMDAGWMDLLLRPIRDHHLSPEWAERGWDGVGGGGGVREGERGGGYLFCHHRCIVDLVDI